MDEFLKDKDTPHSTRLKAAQIVLQIAELDDPTPIGPTDPADMEFLLGKKMGKEYL